MPSTELVEEPVGDIIECVEALQITMSRGALEQWLRSRSRTQLQASGDLSAYTLVCASFAGVDPTDDEPFMAAFVTDQWMRACGSLDPARPGLLGVFSDGTHKQTERKQLCLELQAPEGGGPSLGRDFSRFLRRWRGRVHFNS